MECAACFPLRLMPDVSLSGWTLMKSLRMIVWLVSVLRVLRWRILAILSKSGVKISSDEGHGEVSGVNLWEWRVNHHSRVERRLELCTLSARSRLVLGQATWWGGNEPGENDVEGMNCLRAQGEKQTRSDEWIRNGYERERTQDET